MISERQGVEPIDDGTGPQHSAGTRPVVHLGKHGRQSGELEVTGHADSRAQHVRHRARGPCRPGGRERGERLAHVLRAALTPPTPRRATKPTRASKLRRLADKKRRAEVKARRRRPDAE